MNLLILITYFQCCPLLSNDFKAINRNAKKFSFFMRFFFAKMDHCHQ